MVIEHVFVTSRSEAEAQAAAAAYLAERGFVPMVFAPTDGPAGLLDVRRGFKKASKADSVFELPQRLRMEYDRGRVSVAASIEPSLRWGGGGGGNFSLSGGAFTTKPKHMVLHERLIRAIVLGVEQLLAYNGSGAPDYTAWDAVEDEICAAVQQRKRRHRRNLLIFVGVVVLLVILSIAAGIIASR